MTDSNDAGRARGRRNFLLLAALFLVPIIVVFAMYYGGLWSPSGSAAKGALIHPAQPLLAQGLRDTDGKSAGIEAFQGKWSLIYVGDGACDEACRTALTYGRQTRIAVGKDMDRVQRVFLSTGNCCDQEYLGTEQPGLVTLDASSTDAADLLRQFPGERRSSLYIVDPLGNLMMRHDATQVINKDLLSDLKKLLKLSHIG
jgi:SCO1/SenC